MSLLRHVLPLFTKYSVLQVETHLRMIVEASQNRIQRACRFGHTLCHASRNTAFCKSKRISASHEANENTRPSINT